MGFLALIMALVLEQIRPLSRGNWGHWAYDKVQSQLHVNTQTGERRLAVFAWCALIIGMALLCALRPEVYVTAGDHRIEQLCEAALMQEWGGRTVIVPRVPRPLQAQTPTLRRALP